MVKIEQDALFASLCADDSSAPAESNTVMPTQDEHLVIDTDNEDRVSVAPSVYSLTSSLRDKSFRHVHGRSLTAHSEIYHLPVDEEEATRLQKQHHLTYLVARNDHYYGITEKIREVLAPSSERQRRVLDLGCGPGAWTLQCANDFPHAEVLGVDLAPTSPPNPPSNCHFEVDDLNLGLEHFFGPTFDLIHARLLNSGIKDYAGLVDQVSRCLRPGGMAIFVESDFRVWSEDKRVLIPPNFYTPLPARGRAPLGLGANGRSVATRGDRVRTVPTNWAMPAWMAMMCKCVRAQGGNVDAATLLKTWMREHPNYTDVQAIDLWAPAGPWSATRPDDWTQHPNFVTAGEMSRDNMINLMKSARPLLYQWMSEAEVAELEGKVVRELEFAVHPMYVRIQVAVGYSHDSST